MEALGFFLMIIGIVAISVWGATQQKREFNETIRGAIDAGQKLDTETIAALGKPPRTSQADLRGGIVLVALALGLMIAGLMAAGVLPGVTGWDDEAATGFYVAAAIVGAIGVGQLIASLARSAKKEP
jgi:hypothetical protein